MIYFTITVFFQSILSIFFRSIEVIGRHNIPTRGPVIFTINHANQFMDAVMVICTCQPRKMSYLMAEASWKRRIIGDVAWALDVVPVKRAQDNAKKGTGELVYIERFVNKDAKKEGEEKKKKSGDEHEQEDDNAAAPRITVKGKNTKFTTELAVGDKVRPPNTAFGLKIKEIISDTELKVDTTDLPADFPFIDANGKAVAYDILKRTPLDVVFAKVLDKLAVGGAIGIFPEGGSHDRTDLLPLKVGISLIAYSALEKMHTPIPIVPVGLSYFQVHRWRARCVVEYGRPIWVDPTKLKDFQQGEGKRRQVCNELMSNIETSMRSVLVSSPDYETLQLVHAARRLYQKSGLLDTRERQDLSRRFTEGYKRLTEQTQGNPPQEWVDLQKRIQEYQEELKDLGLKDFQVPALSSEHLEASVEEELMQADGDKFLSFLQFPYHLIHLLTLLAVSAIPMLLLNAPIGILANLYAESRRKKALAKSKVKIHGYDVMMTEKVMFCFVMVPSLWMVYGFLAWLFAGIKGPGLALFMMLMPVSSYLGIVVVEAGMLDWRDLRPYLMRLLPSSRRRLAALPGTRKQLQEDLRLFIRRIGPSLGQLYYGKDLDWNAIQAEYRKQQEAEKAQEDKKSQ